MKLDYTPLKEDQNYNKRKTYAIASSLWLYFKE